MKIRRIHKDDLIHLNKIGLAVAEFRIGKKKGFWSIQALRRWQKSKEDVLLGAFSNKKLVGFILCAVHRPTGKATIENIWVSPVFRQQGLAERLLLHAVKRLRKKNAVYLVAYTKTDNEKSLGFFERNHFQKEERVFWLDKEI